MSTIEETLEPKDTDAAPIEPEHEGGDAETPAATDWVKGPSKSPKSASVSGCVQMTAEETQTPDGATDAAASTDVTETDSNVRTGYETSIFPRLSLSEYHLGRGSPLCERLRWQIVQQYEKNISQRTIAKNLGLAPSTIHNIIKRYKECGEICTRKGQGRKPILNSRELRTLKKHCIKNQKDCLKDIATWAQEQFGKPLSVNTVRRCIHKCKLTLDDAK
ncbi:uncharacterized protein V6R79_018905 [Siganus canaliculatus]